MLLGQGHDSGAVGGSGGGAVIQGGDQVHEIAADVAGGAVLALDAVPAVLEAGDGEGRALGDGGGHVGLGAGLGADAAAVGPAVGGEDVVLILDDVIGVDIALAAGEGHMVPIVLGGLAEEGDDAALFHGDQNLGGSGGFRAQTHGGTGDSAHAHGFLRGGGAQRQSGGGEGGEEQDFRCLSRCMSHVEVRFLSVSGCARERAGRGLIYRPSGPAAARWSRCPWRRRGCPSRSFSGCGPGT